MRFLGTLLGVISLFALGVDAAADAQQDEAEIYRVGQLEIIDPWAKSEVGGAHAAKLFFEFQNNDAENDRLIAVDSSFATGPSYFRVVKLNGNEREVVTSEAIDLPGGASRHELTEVGYYIELTGLQLPILMGKRVPVTLHFERAGELSLEFTARFHSPKLTRRIKEAAARGDIEALKQLR